MNHERGVQGVPTWFGPWEAPLFGVVHIPRDGVARGGVVICPPLGREHLDTYRGLKLLAQRMCDDGFAVLRFDYRGTGDSTGAQGDEAAVDDYLVSIRSAIDYLRSSGVTRVTLLGLRMGALLAATVAAAHHELAGLALWDPVVDGRKFLREQRVLYKMTAGEGEPAAGTEPILGITFASAAAKRIASLKMPTVLGAPQSLVLVRPERADDPRWHELAQSPHCVVKEIAGQADFIEAPSTAVVKIPTETVAHIAGWLDSTMPSEASRFTPTIQRETVVSERRDGREVIETLEELGPHRLFAIRTTLSRVQPGGPTLLLHNTACEHRVGSGRIWPDTARELAALGMTVVRFDRRGIGDTGLATGEYASIHSAEACSDAVDAASALNVSPDNLMMSGICSGAWNSAYAALQHGARAVVLVNLLLYSLRRVDGSPERLVKITPGTPDGGEPKPEGKAQLLIKHVLRTRLPYRGWLLLGRLGYTQAPEVLMKALGRKRIRTDLVLSPSDVQWYEGHRGLTGMARLKRRGLAPKLVAAQTGDHAVLQRDLQLFVRDHLVERVRHEFASGLVPETVTPVAAASGADSRGR